MNAMWLIGGVAAGWALSQLLDPTGGRRRRALIRDKVVSAAHAIGDAVDTTSRDVGNRTRGVIAALGAKSFREPVTDAVLCERVRTRLGGLVSHPGSIEVSAVEGRVTLRGSVLSDEVETLLRGVARIAGVRAVDNRLDVHDEAGQVPGLQGAPTRRGPGRFELMQTEWSPTARLLVGVGGGYVTLAGVRRRGLTALVLTAAGLTTLARALTNLELKRLFGIGAGRHAIVIQKTITVAAPIEEVYESFPRFMAHVHDVRRSGDGRARWTVTGPAGVTVEWETEETVREAPFRLGWKTVEGSPIAHAGIVHFEPEAAGTRIHVQMSYNPPAGAVGHALATILGADPRRALDADLVRFKSLLEDGKTSVGRRTVTRDEIAG